MRTRLWQVLLLLVPAGAAAQPAPALRASVDVAALAERRATSWDAAPLAAVTLRHDRPWLALETVGSLARGAPASWRLLGEGSALLRSPTIGGWNGTVSGERSAVSLERAADAARLHALTVTVGRSRRFTGFWIGSQLARLDPGHRRVGTDTLDAISLPARAALVHTVGGWHQWGAATVSVTVSAHSAQSGPRAGGFRDSAIVHGIQSDTGYSEWIEHIKVPWGGESTRTHWAETDVRVAWSGERLALHALAGGRPSIGPGQRAAAWTELGGAVRVRPSLWVTGSVGVTPSRPDLGITHRRFARLGLQLSPTVLRRPSREAQPRPTALACSLESIGDGNYLFSVRVPQARIVEISGDVTGWKPVVLAQVAPNRWEVPLRIAPGTYRVSIRVDGSQWTAPPGTPSVDDDFGGSAGLLIAR